MARTPPPKLKEMLSALRQRLRDFRYFAADVGYQIGRGPRAAGRAVSRGWFALPLSARRGAAAAIAALALILTLALVARPGLPCGFPGTDPCQATEDARALVPADALVYAHLVTDTGFEQFELALDVVAEMPQLSRQLYGRVLAALPGPGGAAPSIERDLSEWLGDELAVAVLPTDPESPAEVVLLKVGQREGAEQYAQSLAVGETSELELAGRTLVLDSREQATAFVGDFLVVGPREGVESVVEATDPEAAAVAAIDDADETPPADEEEAPADQDEVPADEEEVPTDEDETPAEGDEAPAEEDEVPADEEEAPAEERARTLADDEIASSVLDELPEPRLATAYVSREGAGRLLGPGATLAPFEPLIDAGATEGAAISLGFDEDAIELDVRSSLDPERAERRPGFFAAFPRFEPQLDDSLGEGTLAYVGFGDPAETLASLLEQATRGEAEGLAGAVQELGQRLRRLARVDLAAQLLPALGSEAALAIEPGGELEPSAPPEEPEVPEAPDEAEGTEDTDATGDAEDAPAEDPPAEDAPTEEAPAEGPEAAPGQGVEPELPDVELPDELPLEPEDELASEQPIPLLTLLVEGIDADPVGEVLSELQGPLSRALAPEDAERVPSFRGLDIDGVEVQAMRLTPVIELAYGIVDDVLTIATGPVAIQRQTRGQDGLAGASRFEGATEGLTDETSFLGYLDLAGLVAVAEREGLAADPVYAPFAEEVRRLGALGLSVDAAGAELTSGVRLTLVR